MCRASAFGILLLVHLIALQRACRRMAHNPESPFRTAESRTTICARQTMSKSFALPVFGRTRRLNAQKGPVKPAHSVRLRKIDETW